MFPCKTSGFTQRTFPFFSVSHFFAKEKSFTTTGSNNITGKKHHGENRTFSDLNS
jgi:hypothetical protein